MLFSGLNTDIYFPGYPNPPYDDHPYDDDDDDDGLDDDDIWMIVGLTTAVIVAVVAVVLVVIYCPQKNKAVRVSICIIAHDEIITVGIYISYEILKWVKWNLT